MDARILDVVIGLACFALLVLLLAVLPAVFDAGVAYIAAILIFILTLSGAGFLVNKQIT